MSDGILVTEVTTTETPGRNSDDSGRKEVDLHWETGELTIASFVDGPNGSYEA